MTRRDDAHESLNIGSRDVSSIQSLDSSVTPYRTRVPRLAGSLRAQSVAENPVRPGQEWPHHRGDRAPVQMSCRGQSVERGIQVSASTRITRVHGIRLLVSLSANKSSDNRYSPRRPRASDGTNLGTCLQIRVKHGTRGLYRCSATEAASRATVLRG